ncbi:MAG TPA: alpha/beta hydrolase, partial [Microbacteriaceae bacterium]|nr:alpha/beta hydrolase [Microbacteriaceae bacterium]
EFGHGDEERHDLAAAMAFVHARGLPSPWLLGWSFGTEVLLKHARDLAADRAASGTPIAGAILLSPPLRRTTADELARWADADVPVVAIIPQLDDYLRPPEARERFAIAPNVELVEVAGGKHLWVGEEQTYRVLSEIVARLNPAALPLPTVWAG